MKHSEENAELWRNLIHEVSQFFVDIPMSDEDDTFGELMDTPTTRATAVVDTFKANLNKLGLKLVKA